MTYSVSRILCLLGWILILVPDVRPAGAADNWHYAIKPRFEAADLFVDGSAAVKLNGRWGLVDGAGRWLADPVYDDIRPHGEGLRAVKKGALWGFIDSRGKTVIPFRYLDAGSFSQGYAPIKAKRGWRFIDRQGRAAFKAVYDELEDLSEGLAVARRGKHRGYVQRGSWKFLPVKGASRLYAMSEGMAVFISNKRRGFLDKGAKVAIKARYEAATRFNGGHAGVKRGGRWQVIDRNGKTVIAPRWRNMRAFSEGWTAYQVDNGLWGYSSADGKAGLAPRYSNAFAFRDGIAIVRQGKKRYFIDRRGQHLTQPIFDDVFRFNDGLAPVKVGKNWGYIAFGKPATGQPTTGPQPEADRKTPAQPPKKTPLDRLVERINEHAYRIRQLLKRPDGEALADEVFDPTRKENLVRTRFGEDKRAIEGKLEDEIARIVRLLPADSGKSLGAGAPRQLAEQLADLGQLVHANYSWGQSSILLEHALDLLKAADKPALELRVQWTILLGEGQFRRGDDGAARATFSDLHRLDRDLLRGFLGDIETALFAVIFDADPSLEPSPRFTAIYDLQHDFSRRLRGPNDPKTILSQIRMARVQFLTGHQRQAQASYDRLLPILWPDGEKRYASIYWARREVFHNLGMIAQQQGRLDDAVAFLKLADGFADLYSVPEVDNGHPHMAIPPGVDLARLHVRRGAPDQAEALLLEILQQPPRRQSDYRAQLQTLIRIQLDRGRPDQARTSFDLFADGLGADAPTLRRQWLGE